MWTAARGQEATQRTRWPKPSRHAGSRQGRRRAPPEAWPGESLAKLKVSWRFVKRERGQPTDPLFMSGRSVEATGTEAASAEASTPHPEPRLRMRTLQIAAPLLQQQRRAALALRQVGQKRNLETSWNQWNVHTREGPAVQRTNSPRTGRSCASRTRSMTRSTAPLSRARALTPSA